MQLKVKRLMGLTGLVVSAGFFLSGCTMSQPSFSPTSLRNKITVAETVERLELFTEANGLNLSARDQDAVSNFIYQYSRAGQGPLYVNIPRNTANSAGIAQAKSAIGARMKSMGIPASALQSGQYMSRPGIAAPIVVSYRRLTTQPIDCQAGADLTNTSTNQPYGGYGCSQTANLAAMIDNPRQLLAPYEQGSRPADRRVVIMDKYKAGEATGAAVLPQQSVNVGSGG
ncbi:MAG: CpaD family pilus assembly lipoprotein [Robiginitomaculum sp.]